MNGTPIYLPQHLWKTADSDPDHAPIPEEFLERARRAPWRDIPDPPYLTSKPPIPVSAVARGGRTRPAAT